MLCMRSVWKKKTVCMPLPGGSIHLIIPHPNAVRSVNLFFGIFGPVENNLILTWYEHRVQIVQHWLSLVQIYLRTIRTNVCLLGHCRSLTTLTWEPCKGLSRLERRCSCIIDSDIPYSAVWISDAVTTYLLVATCPSSSGHRRRAADIDNSEDSNIDYRICYTDIYQHHGKLAIGANAQRSALNASNFKYHTVSKTKKTRG